VFGLFGLLLFGVSAGAIDAAGLEELSQTFQRPLAVVVDDLVVSLLEELDGGEALDLDVFKLVGGGVHLGDDNVLRVLELLSKLVPGGSELLAVSAPWGIKLNKDMLVDVLSDGLEVLADEDLDAFLVPVLGDLLREQVLLQGSVQVSLDKGTDGGLIDGAGLGLVLGHVLLQLDQTHAGQLIVLHSEEFKDPLVVLLIGVDSNEQELSLVLLGDVSGGLLGGGEVV